MQILTGEDGERLYARMVCSELQQEGLVDVEVPMQAWETGGVCAVKTKTEL